ncbi:MAG TPA: hypothetical protein VJL81_12670 [Solirubrobacterales bacterium]|nr:hypothetical protein [Solirubrobacterales bacterium]
MKVGTPFGEFPFVYRRVERRDGEVAVIGTVAGVESSVVFDRDDALRAGKALGAAVALLALIRALRRG